MVESVIKTTRYKLILILGQLSPSEWRALKKFVLMYTREQSDNFDLFTILRKNISKLNTNDDVLRLHKEYFPQMTAKTFFNMMSRLTLWVEDWLVYEDMRQSDDKDIRLIRLYNSRGLYKESNAIAKKAIKTATTKPGLSLMATKNLAQIYYYQYFSNNPIKFRERDLLDRMILTHLQSFRNMSMVFRNQSLFFKHAILLDKNQFEDSLQEIIKLLPQCEISNLLSSIETLLVEYDYKSLLSIKEKLERTAILPNSDLHILTTMYALNSTQTLWTKNKFKDAQIVLEVLNYAIKSGVILSDEKIEENLWYSMITIIAITKDFIKTEKFIDKWHKKVNSKNHIKLRALSMAQLCFHQEKFPEIRDHIYNMEIVDSKHKERANSLIVISLYDDRKNNYKLFFDFANNLLRQLKRSKSRLSRTDYESYINLTKTLLSLAKHSYTESDIVIENSENLMYRTWLRKEIKKQALNQ